MQKEEIIISATHKNQLAAEFNCSKQAVWLSLKYVFNSPQAKAMRARAKELLLAEAEKIETQNQ